MRERRRVSGAASYAFLGSLLHDSRCSTLVTAAPLSNLDNESCLQPACISDTVDGEESLAEAFPRSEPKYHQYYRSFFFSRHSDS